MKTSDPISVLLGRLWGKLMMEGLFHEAVQLALIARSIGKTRRDDTMIEAADSVLNRASQEISLSQSVQTSESKANSAIHCSFCGKTKDETSLFGGASAIICKVCVGKFSSIPS